jgi:signal transduction histidine kinase
MRRSEPWLSAVGGGIWLFVGLSRLPTAWPSWLLPWLLYGVGILVGSLRRGVPPAIKLGALAMQSGAALLLPLLGLKGFEGLLLSMVVAQAPTIVSLRASVWLWLGQLPLLLAVVVHDKGVTDQLEIVGAYSGFSLFSLLVYRIVLSERRARRELAETNAVLLATRALVVEGSLHGERLRIARELHDSLGHHLTALSLQLELAQRLVDGRATEPVRHARTVARDSLVDIRRVVTAMRSPMTIDCVAALKAVAAGIPSPRILILADGDRPAGSAGANHTLFRCAQEAITNSVKHAAAQNVWVRIERTGERTELFVRDDGDGVDVVEPGNGLRGIEERVSQAGGTVAFTSRLGHGFEVHLSLPDREATP